jgi:type II secretory pathway pseudopilin PulG
MFIFAENFKKRLRCDTGTTLVEVMIAFSLFGILIALTVSNFKQSLDLQQLSTLLLESHDSVGLLFEQVSREVRTSENLSVSGANGNTQISFRHQDGYTATYRYDGDEKRIYRSDGVNSIAVTSDDPRIQITKFSAQIPAGTQGTEYQRLVMSIETTVYDKSNNAYTSVIQTTVSPRFYE